MYTVRIVEAFKESQRKQIYIVEDNPHANLLV